MKAEVSGDVAAAEEAKRRRDSLGFVETIYEEEDENDTVCTSISDPSPEFVSPSPTPLHSRINSWCRVTGRETDVVIYVQNARFNLHKEPLITKSRYLKRHLNKVSQLTLSPPLKLTAETFTLLLEFFYDADLIITPFNLAAIRTAAELLEMTVGDDGGLVRKTENYFRRSVTVRPDYTLIVLRSSLSFLPEAETTAFLVSRCVEALCVMDEDDGVSSCMDAVKVLGFKDFLVILESMNQRLSCSHDLLYKLVDLYLKEHSGKMTEEQKMRICNNVSCAMLSPNLVMHAVQNPRMPLRFVVQAMFAEQLNTRRSIIVSASDNNHRHIIIPKHPHNSNNNNISNNEQENSNNNNKNINNEQENSNINNNISNNEQENSNNNNLTTLGAILERDAALRQAAQLKEAMHATSSRIRLLEKELSDMRKFLREPSDDRRDSSDGSRSFRVVGSRLNKISKGERGSVSSGNFRFDSVINNRKLSGSGSSESSREECPVTVKKNLRQRFIRGLMSTFRISKKKPTEIAGKVDGDAEKVVVDGGGINNNVDVSLS